MGEGTEVIVSREERKEMLMVEVNFELAKGLGSPVHFRRQIRTGGSDSFAEDGVGRSEVKRVHQRSSKNELF